jgi:hypothetical protein
MLVGLILGDVKDMSTVIRSNCEDGELSNCSRHNVRRKT